MATTTTNPTTMIKAYTTDKTGGKVSSESTVIVPCEPPRDGQQASEFVEDAALYVTKAARQYFDDHLPKNGEDCFSLQELEDVSDAAQAGAIVCVFDVPAEASLKLVKSAEILVAGADWPEASLADRRSLMRFLNARIWKDLTDVWNLDMDIGRKINLFSGKTSLSLDQFKIDLQRLVNDNFTQHSHVTEATKRTVFWRRIMEPEAPSGSTQWSYTYGSGGSNTFPRTSGPSHSRPRFPSESWVSMPRSMPDSKLKSTDQYDGNARFNGSETLDSAKGGKHGS